MAENTSVFDLIVTNKEAIEIAISFATFLVLLITLIWVVKYTKETEGMKKEMVFQRYLSLQPFFLFFHEFDRGVHRLFLKNIGNGVALHSVVGFENGLRRSDKKEIFISESKFDLINKDESKLVEFDFWKTSDGSGGNGLSNNNVLFPPPPLEVLADKNIALTAVDIDLVVEYENILGDKKSQKFAIKNGKIKMEKNSFFKI